MTIAPGSGSIIELSFYDQVGQKGNFRVMANLEKEALD
jgi:hypothetical protein